MHEGVLVVHHETREIVDYNNRFLSMWGIKDIDGERIHDEILIKQVIDQLVDPEGFLKQVMYLYENPYKSSLEIIEIKGDFFFERRSEPLIVNGEVRGRIFFFRDISEEKLAREKLFDQNTLLETIISTIPYAVFWKDRESRFLGCNKIFLSDAGLEKYEEIIGKTDFDMCWRTHADHYRFYDKQVMTSGVAQTNFEERLVRGDGTELTLLTSKVPLVDSNKRVIGILGIYTDITDFKHQQELIKEQESLLVNSSQMSSLGEMAAGIAHEINNPLSIIRMSMIHLAKLLSHGETKTAQVSGIIEEVNETVERIAKIIQGMRNISRSSQGNKEKFTIQEVLTDVLSIARERFKSNGVAIQEEVPKPLSEIELLADRIQISQVIINILNNAYDAIIPLRMDKKWIRIELTQAGSYLQLAIIDCGEGIPRSVREKMFNPFYTTKDIGKGTGIGLSISKAMVEKNGGKIFYDEASTNTSFIIQLPIT